MVWKQFEIEQEYWTEVIDYLGCRLINHRLRVRYIMMKISCRLITFLQIIYFKKVLCINFSVSGVME